MIAQAKNIAYSSPLDMRHGAVLFTQSGRSIQSVGHNDYGKRICDHDVPSIHAEARVIDTIYRRRLLRPQRCEKEG